MADHVWPFEERTLCSSGLQDKQIKRFGKQANVILGPCYRVVCQQDVVPLCSDTNRLHPPVMMCCVSVLCVRARARH